eukprot:jgi/Ulvmu1/2952/UM149_0035.1
MWHMTRSWSRARADGCAIGMDPRLKPGLAQVRTAVIQVLTCTLVKQHSARMTSAMRMVPRSFDIRDLPLSLKIVCNVVLCCFRMVIALRGLNLLERDLSRSS